MSDEKRKKSKRAKGRKRAHSDEVQILAQIMEQIRRRLGRCEAAIALLISNGVFTEEELLRTLASVDFVRQMSRIARDTATVFFPTDDPRKGD